MEFHEYRIDEDARRKGAYDVIPGLEGDINITKHTPNIIPTQLHMHKRQTDYFTVVEGNVLFRLLYDDGRPEEKFILKVDDYKTIIIPAGVWHNYMALDTPATMVFYITHKYDKADEFSRPCNPEEWQRPHEK